MTSSPTTKQHRFFDRVPVFVYGKATWEARCECGEVLVTETYINRERRCFSNPAERTSEADFFRGHQRHMESL